MMMPEGKGMKVSVKGIKGRIEKAESAPERLRSAGLGYGVGEARISREVGVLTRPSEA